MPNITYTGDEPYSGTDPGNDGKRLDMQPGGVADVSDAKLKQLLADFPGRFKKGGRRAGAAGSTGKDDQVKTYAEIAGDDLRTIALERGVAFDAAAEDDVIRAALTQDDKAAAEAAKT